MRMYSNTDKDRIHHGKEKQCSIDYLTSADKTRAGKKLPLSIISIYFLFLKDKQVSCSTKSVYCTVDTNKHINDYRWVANMNSDRTRHCLMPSKPNTSWRTSITYVIHVGRSRRYKMIAKRLMSHKEANVLVRTHIITFHYAGKQSACNQTHGS